jgi:phenylalanyl-tRNA synthetase alpha chain
MHDTFYVDTKAPDGSGHLLRTHTSPMQVRHAVQHVKRHAPRWPRARPCPRSA